MLTRIVFRVALFASTTTRTRNAHDAHATQRTHDARRKNVVRRFILRTSWHVVCMSQILRVYIDAKFAWYEFCVAQILHVKGGLHAKFSRKICV